MVKRYFFLLRLFYFNECIVDRIFSSGGRIFRCCLKQSFGALRLAGAGGGRQRRGMSACPHMSGIIWEGRIFVFGGSRRAEEGAYRARGQAQGILLQMRIAHGCARIAVPQQALDFVERVSGIDKDAGEGMPQVMDAHVVQPSSCRR